MSEMEPRPTPSVAGADRAEATAASRAVEAAYLRRGVWLLPVVSVLFLVGLWAVQTFLFEVVPDPPAAARDVTAPLKRLYEVAHGTGMRFHAGTDGRVLAAWLAERVGAHGAVPDLAGAGLAPVGARELNLGRGWGVIDYRDAAGPAGDLLAVLAPLDAVRVPAEAAGRTVAGREVWLLREGAVGFAWVPGRAADWVLVSARDDAGLLAAAGALLAAGDAAP